MALLAPPALVEGPAIAPGLHGLVASAVPANEGDTRWEQGFEFVGEGCVEVVVWNSTCTGGTWDAKPDKSQPQFPSLGEGYPWTIEVATTCNSRGWSTMDYVGRITRQMEAATSKGLEEAFWTGGGVPDVSALVEDATVVEGTAVSPAYGLAALEQSIADCGPGARGMIHAPVKLASLWGYQGMFVVDGPRLTTYARGNVVVAGAGYPGTGPGGSAAPSKQAWAYATGMVQVRLGDIQIVPGSLAEALDRRTNMLTYRAERSASAVYDPCCGPLAALIDLGAS